MTIRLRAAHTEQVHSHLCSTYPEEGCGVLLGREQNGVRQVERVVTFDNVREDSRYNRYLISPEQFLRAEKEGRGAGLDVLGFFHSHPDHPARPSQFDLDHAWPWYSYVIVSVENAQAVDTRCYRMLDDRSRFEPENLELAGAREARETSGDRS
jgi:proteasome lid subunit RPN8/RPN11